MLNFKILFLDIVHIYEESIMFYKEDIIQVKVFYLLVYFYLLSFIQII